MGLLKAQTSFSEASGRQNSSSCPRLLPPFTCDAGNLLSRETAWLWFFVLLTVILYSLLLFS